MPIIKWYFYLAFQLYRALFCAQHGNSIIKLLFHFASCDANLNQAVREQPAFLNVKGFLSNIPTQNCLLWKSKGNVLLSKAATFIKQNLGFFTLLNSEIYNQLFPIMIGYKGQARALQCLQETCTLQSRSQDFQRHVAGELSMRAQICGLCHSPAGRMWA